MCGANLMEKNRTEDLIEMLGLKETVVQMAKAFGVRGRPKKTWKTQVEKESKSIGLEKKDAMNRARWRVRVKKIADKV